MSKVNVDHTMPKKGGSGTPAFYYVWKRKYTGSFTQEGLPYVFEDITHALWKTTVSAVKERITGTVGLAPGIPFAKFKLQQGLGKPLVLKLTIFSAQDDFGRLAKGVAAFLEARGPTLVSDTGFLMCDRIAERAILMESSPSNQRDWPRPAGGGRVPKRKTVKK